MSRPREFDVDHALEQSMEVFWTKGFKGTSYEDLTRTTKVKKQSLYGVFKDKRELFRHALALYRQRVVGRLEDLAASKELTPVQKLEAICDGATYQNDETLRRGCLMVNTALEFGSDDQEINGEVMLMFGHVERILEQIICDGQQQGLITARQSCKELAVYLNNAFIGAKVLEKSGASREQIAAALRTSSDLLVSENARR